MLSHHYLEVYSSNVKTVSMKDQNIIGRILASYPDLSAFSEEEQESFRLWLEQKDNRQFVDQLADKDYRAKELAALYELSKENEKCWNDLGIETKSLQPVRTLGGFGSFQRYVVAASLLLMVIAGVVVWHNYNTHSSIVVTEAKLPDPDVLPGGYGATLTLADGTTISLDSSGAGDLAIQGNTRVSNANGQVTYLRQGRNTDQLIYNKLSTTRGQTYTTRLSDGTNVVVNTESSLRFPVAFTEGVRKVELVGEAYFEVAPSGSAKGKRPFIVNVNGMEVEVLGTHFNISAYEDENTITTTLLEGKVKVNAAGSSVTLEPGAQVEMQRHTQRLSKKSNVNVDEVVAWKNGYFHFSQSRLPAVMRQLARWYDLQIVYEGTGSGDLFEGEIPRNTNLSTVLKILSTYGVHCKLEGRKLTVLR